MTRPNAMFRPLAIALAAPLVLAAGAPVQAQEDPRADIETATSEAPLTKGEERLAKLIEGRVAGEPVRCIRTLPNQRMQTIDQTAYVFGSGNTIYVQRTRNPERISDNDALVTQRFNASQMCKLDVMTTVDRVLGFFTGAVFFEDFVPYSRRSGETDGEA